MAQLGSCCSDDLGVVNDSVCFNIALVDTDGDPLAIWNDATSYIINGTIMVENNGIIGASPTAELTVNGAPVGGFVIGPGEARSITMDNINSIGIVGAGIRNSKVKVSFSLNYKF